MEARDPYCGWDHKQKRCTTIEESSNMNQWTQNITECPVRHWVCLLYRSFLSHFYGNKNFITSSLFDNKKQKLIITSLIWHANYHM